MKRYLYMILVFLFFFDVLAFLAFYQQNFITRPRVIFFDVGEGDAIMIDVSPDTQILVDGGDGKDILNKLGKYMPFYDKEVELLIMTHPDKDHMGGLVEVLKYYKVDQILETGTECRTDICKEWEKLVKEKNIPVRYAEFGQNIEVANRINMSVLYPFENLKDKKTENDNNSSIVMKLVLNDDSRKDSFLLTADAGFEVENDLLEGNINVESEVIKISHHGSKNATSNKFLRAVRPKKAVISVGKNRYGHPSEKLLNRLTNMKIEIFRTDEKGDLIF